MATSTTPDDISRARRAVRQQAETAAMLGVDYVPCFRTGENIAEVEASAAPPSAATDPARAAAQKRMDDLRATSRTHPTSTSPRRTSSPIWSGATATSAPA
ncbi:MAG: hypothetical protein HND58_03210 [Planctomycetota bacterium]|nr:MAG: hypothetical protein HND58_03210 [Planctomycetota bacterium]